MIVRRFVWLAAIAGCSTADPPAIVDTTYTVDFAYLLREQGKQVHVVHDTHVFGIFPRDTWLALLSSAGFKSRAVPDPWGRQVFVGDCVQ